MFEKIRTIGFSRVGRIVFHVAHAGILIYCLLVSVLYLFTPESRGVLCEPATPEDFHYKIDDNYCFYNLDMVSHELLSWLLFLYGGFFIVCAFLFIIFYVFKKLYFYIDPKSTT